MENFTKLTEAANRNPNKDNCRQLLKYLRQQKLRHPDLVLQFGLPLLKKSLGTEEWTVREQVFIAALDQHEIEIAKEQLRRLQVQFGPTPGQPFFTRAAAAPGQEQAPKPTFVSQRTAWLRSLLDEAEKNFESATTLLRALVEAAPDNAIYHKRLVAIMKEQGNIYGAIQAMNDYLAKFMADEIAWLELVDLYLAVYEYEKAAFCMEELILVVPHNYHILVKYAEILYTIGGLDNLKKARMYFAHSLYLELDNNLRGLYGLLMTVTAIGAGKGGAGREADGERKAEELFQWSRTQLLNKYEKSPLKDLLQSALAQCQDLFAK